MEFITRTKLHRLVFLSLFFCVTYTFANAVSSQRSDVHSIVLGWEGHIPFVEWSIIPYWSIDVFYGLSVFVCRTKDELDIHVRRLLTAQIVAVTCFLLFPLQYTFARPATHGLPHLLFVALTSVDRPFNQAPSLHIALLVILWCLYKKHVPRFARWPLHAWSALIGVSVLTTYQHHFFDVPTGALLGLFCVRLWPEGRQALLKDSQLLVGTFSARSTAITSSGSFRDSSLSPSCSSSAVNSDGPVATSPGATRSSAAHSNFRR
jgi:membrane-associated phospholipid phosphatase